MTTDAVSELAALQAELSASQRKRQSAVGDRAPASHAPEPPPRADTAEEDGHAEREVGDFVNLLKEFVEDAEHNIAEHPAASVVGALLIGILIGRLLARR
jgi:ElaB/YqjD/DUF883 family membrane-anchored ribosome-binding protein